MITYPSTHGVFETQVKELCALVHRTAAASTWTAPT
jgi:glycine cleavage system protein P-like pyridoxal-binding family